MWGSQQRLTDYFGGRLRRAVDELARVDADVLLSENVDVLVATLLEKHIPVELRVDWDDPTRTAVTEVTTQVRDRFDDEVYDVPASRIVITFPISGTTAMLDYQASHFSLSGRYGEISGDKVVVEVTERTLNADTIRGQVERVKQDIEKRVEWANADLANFRLSADQTVRTKLASRKERILNDRAVEEALGIPVQASGTRPPPVPTQRTLVRLETRTAQKAFVPEPVLDEAIYQDILIAVRAWATSLERTPGTANKLDEEELRDLLLGNLNTYWQGAAGGELFNGSGKTDILIRHADRNVFIAECKIWRGAKGITDAIDQLLSYVVWRDGKAALLIFIKTADPAATISKLHQAVESHERHVLTRPSENSSSRVDYIVTADDEGRRVSLAVIPVIIRATTS